MQSTDGDTVYYQGKKITTIRKMGPGSADIISVRRGREPNKTSARNYDCDTYQDCLFEASVRNASKLPCSECNDYIPRYSDEYRTYLEPLLRLVG